MAQPDNRRRRRFARGDLETPASPALTPEDWQSPDDAVDRLRQWAEDYAAASISWYMRDKRAKRWASRLLRAAAVVLAVAGGLAPLVQQDTTVGYVLLALAAGCVAFDTFFGLSAGWMRDITTAQGLQGRLVRFQLAWVTWQAAGAGVIKPESSDPEPADSVQRALTLINGLVTDVAIMTEAETARWVSDFHQSLAGLRMQAAPSSVAPTEPVAAPDTTRP